MKDIIEANLIESRIVKVYGDMNDDLTSSVIDQLLYLDSISDDNIHIYINSGGGFSTSIFAICDTISLLRSKVVTINIARANSAAALLLCAGNKGMRYAYPNSTIMIHRTAGQLNHDYVDELGSTLGYFTNCADKYKDLFIKFTGISEKKYSQMISPATYMTPEEAMKLGIIDDILTKETKIPGNKKEESSYKRPF